MNGEQTEYMQAKEWIADLCDDPGTTHPNKSISFDGAVDAFRALHEHMLRWRSIDEIPSFGERVEVAYRCSEDWITDWSSIGYFELTFQNEIGCSASNKAIGRPYAWRPVGGLPATGDHQLT